MTSRSPSGVQTPKLRSSGIGFGLGDLGLALPLVEPVEHAAVDLLGGLAGPVGVGAHDPDLLTLLERLRQRVPALVGLPPAHRRQARVGGVALGDAVPDDPDLGDELLGRLALRRRDDLLLPRGRRVVAGEALAVDGLDGHLGALGAEPAQVERGAVVGRLLDLAVLPFPVLGEVVRRLVAIDPRAREECVGAHECTVKKRSLTWRS